MSDLRFQNWRENHPFIEKYLHFPDREDSGWGRIHATWHEKHDGIDLTHLCAFTVDLKTGDLYLDCTKRKIWVKCLLLTIGRPLFGSFKTIYHIALPISIPLEIFKAIFYGYYEGDSAKTIAKNAAIRVWHNIEDIVRTPLYTIVLTVVTLSAVVIGPLAPRKLYDLRALAGRIENALNRGEESWTLAPCFQPISDIITIESRNYTEADTVYDQEDTLHGLNNLVRSYVNYRRNNRNLFDNYGRLVQADAAYISPAAQ